MSLPDFAIPDPLFTALAGGGGEEAIRLLTRVQYWRHMELLNRVVDAAGELGPGRWASARDGYHILDDAQRLDPRTAGMVIGYPAVGAWSIHTLRAFLRYGEAPGADPSGLCAIAAAAAIRVGLQVEIEVPVLAGAVVLPSLGAAAADGDSAVVRNTASHAEVVSAGGRVEVPPDPYREAPGWSGLRPVCAGPLDGLIDDLDPFRMPAAQCLASRLPAAEARIWDAAFKRAWPLLDQHHPDIAAEIAAIVTVIVPLLRPADGVRSSSSLEAFGAVAMSRPLDSCSLAATLVHEVQHLKLSAVLDMVELTAPDDGRRFYAPWREDPRPVNALLQGAYAFLGVSRFWRCQRHLESGAAGMRAHAEFAWCRGAADLVTQTLLSSKQLTPRGVQFVQEMAQTLNDWKADTVPRGAQALARSRTDQHLSRWRSTNGFSPPQ